MRSMTYTGSGDGAQCLIQEASILWERQSPQVDPHTPPEILEFRYSEPLTACASCHYKHTIKT